MRYRKLDSRFWIDEGVRNLSAQEKLIALYCLTAQTNRAGLFHFSPGRACEDLGIPDDQFEEGFKKVRDSLHWAWDERARVLFVPTWFKYNAPDNRNVLMGSLSDLDDVPATKLLTRYREVVVEQVPEELREFFEELIAHHIINGSGNGCGNGSGNPSGNGCANGSGNGYPTHDHDHQHEHEQEQDQDSAARGNISDSELPNAKPRKRSWPDNLALTADMCGFAVEHGIEPESEFEAWHDDCLAHDRKYVDWPRAWRGRIRRAAQYAGERSRNVRRPTIEVAKQRLAEVEEDE